MGIFSKIGKGIKKVFSKIGKAIKKQFKRFGKFMNKIGVLGQIAMMFILPGVGNALLSGISGAFGSIVGQTAAQAGAAAAGTAASTAATATATAAGQTAAQAAAAGTAASATASAAATAAGTLGKATGMMASKSALIRGAGTVLQSAGNFVSAGAKAFSTVTEGITSFMGEFTKTALNKIPGVNIGSAAPTFGDAWQNVQNNVMKNSSATLEAFNKSIGIKPTAGATKFGTAGYTIPENVTVAGQITKGVTPGLDLTTSPTADLNLAGGQTSGIDMGNLTSGAAKDLGVNVTDVASPSLQTVDPFKVQKTSLLDATVKSTPTPVMDTNIVTRPDGGTFITGGVTTTPTPTTVTPKPDEGLWADVKGIPADLYNQAKTSILDMPKKVGEIPGKFVDNLTGTVTDLPNLAARAALNRQPTPYYQQSSVAIGNVPEFHMPQSEPLQTTEDYVQMYQNPQRSGQGNYGFNNPVGYSQFMKKFASA